MRRVFSRSLWTFGRLLAVVPPILFLVFAFVAVRRELVHSSHELLRLVSDEVAATFKINVSVKSVDASLPGRLVVRDLVLGKEGYGTLLIAPQATVRYNVNALVANIGSPLGAVTSVSAYGPTVFLTRDAQGKLNFAEAFKPKKKGKRPFSGVITVRDATAVYRDMKPVSRTRDVMMVTARGVNAWGDFSTGRGGTFRATAAQTGVSGAAKVYGSFDYKGDVVLNGSAVKISLPFIDRFFVATSAVDLSRGTATGSFLVARGRPTGDKWHFWADASVTGADLQVGRVVPRLTDAAGRIQLAGTDALLFDGSATGAGARWITKGSVTSLGPRPVFWIDAASRSADWRTLALAAPRGWLPQNVSASGRGPAEVHLRGPVTDLKLQGKAQIPRISWKGTAVIGALVSFNRSGSLLAVEASAGVGRGHLAGSADITLGSRLGASGRVRFREVPLGVLAQGVGGTAGGEARFRMVNGRTIGSVWFDAANPSAYGRSASSARGQVQFDGKSVTVTSLLVATPGGFGTASGKVGLDGKLDLQVAAAGLRLKDLAGTSQPQMDLGTLDAGGSVAGSIKNPVFEGRVHAVDVRYLSETADAITGHVRIGRDRFHTTGLTVIRGTSEALLTGDITLPFSPARKLDMSAQVKALDLAELGAYVPFFKTVSGRASGEITSVIGRPDALAAGFSLKVEDARYKSFAVPILKIDGHYDRGALTVSDLVATRGTASLEASGSVARGGALDLKFALSGFPLTDAVTMGLGRSAPVAGTVNLAGTVSGTTKDPVLSARLFGEGIKIASEDVAVSDSVLSWNDGVLRVSDAKLAVAGGTLSLEGLAVQTTGEGGLESATLTIGPPADNTSVGADLSRVLAMGRGLGLMSDIKNERIRQTALISPEHVQGALTGTVVLGHSGEKTVTRAELSVTSFQAWGASLGALTFSAEAKGGGVEISSLVLEDGDMRISGSGGVSASRTIHADVEGNNISLSRIPALKSDVEGGSGDFSLVASGTLDEPLVQGSLLVKGASVRGVKIESFTTGTVVASADEVEFTEATLTSGNYQVRFAGKAPFSIAKMAMLKGGKVEITAQLLNQDLDVLTVFTDTVQPDRTEGKVEAGVSVSGVWPSPQISGAIRVVDGKIGVEGMENSFEDVQVNIDLLGSQIDIREFTATSSKGGKLEMTGGASLGEDGWVVGATAAAKDIGIKFRNVTRAYGESFDGRLDIDIKASGSLGKPLIAGRVVAHDGSLGLPTIPEKPVIRPKYAFNPSFDLSLEAGQKIKARSARLNVGVRGAVRLASDLNSPSVVGSLNVLDGYLLFPGSRFRVVPIGTISFAVQPPDPARITLDIRAQTNLSSRTASAPLGASSYQVEMAVRGSIDDPRVTFQSYPPGLDSSRILAMLGQQAGVSPGGLGGGADFQKEVTQLFTASFAPGMLEPVELALAQALGLQEVSFGVGQGVDMPLTVQISRRLFDGVSASMWTTLVAGQEQLEWRLMPDVTHRLRLSYGRSRFGDRQVGIEGSVSF